MSTTTSAPPRTTVAEILADALLMLLRAQPTILAWDQAEPAMAVLGLTKADMAAARDRVGHPRHNTPPAPLEMPEVPLGATRRAEPVAYRRAAAGEGGPSHHAKPRAATTSRPVDLNGRLRCSRCGSWFPPERFRLRTDRIGSGGRRSACDDCHSLANRNRYVSLDAKAAMNMIGIVLSLEEGDAAARLRCVRCGQRLGADDVTTGTISLAHVTCQPGEENTG